MSKYGAVAWLAARQGFAARGAILGRVGFYWVIMLIFSRLWVAVAPETRGEMGRAVEYVWYLAITELVALGVPMLYLGIEQDVRRGDIAYRLGRPISYAWAKLAEGVGEFAVRFAFLATIGMAGAWLFAGGLPADPRGLAWAVPLAFLAGLMMLVIQTMIGLSAFWLQDAAPVYWIMQKFLFIFGGLMIPLSIYPDWLHSVADFTPFSAALYGCGRLVLHYDPALALDTAWRLVAWTALLGVILSWVYRRSLTALTVNGG